MLKNTVTGLNGVDQQYKEAARGCGMNHLQRLVQVELPLAMPTIIGGLRLSAPDTARGEVGQQAQGHPGGHGQDQGGEDQGQVVPADWAGCSTPLSASRIWP